MASYDKDTLPRNPALRFESNPRPAQYVPIQPRPPIVPAPDVPLASRRSKDAAIKLWATICSSDSEDLPSKRARSNVITIDDGPVRYVLPDLHEICEPSLHRPTAPQKVAIQSSCNANDSIAMNTTTQAKPCLVQSQSPEASGSRRKLPPRALKKSLLDGDLIFGKSVNQADPCKL